MGFALLASRISTASSMHRFINSSKPYTRASVIWQDGANDVWQPRAELTLIFPSIRMESCS